MLYSLRRRLAASTAVLTAAAGVAAFGVTAAEASTSATGFTVRTNARWSGVKDSQGVTWDHRAGFNSTANRSDGLATTPIAGTEDDVLYQSNLYGVSSYSTAVPNGVYRVRLLMAEDYHKAAGRRVFDVTAEGATALTGVDIFAAVGRAAAYDRSFSVTVRDGRLDLGFVAKLDRPLISALEVVGTGELPTLPPSSTTTPTYGLGGNSGGATTPTGDRRLIGLGDRGGAGLAPQIVNGSGTSVFAAGGGDARSEMFWASAPDGALLATRYATITSTFDIKHQLNNPATGAAPSPSTWHTVYQLHGRTRMGTWPGPPLTISVQGGVYRVGGGASVPDSAGKLSYKGSWYQPYLPAPENVWRRFEVTTYLDGPGKGWVSIKVDGKTYIDKFYPVAGTIYTEGADYSHRALNIKSGLYTAVSSPAWNRKVEMKNMALTIAEGTSVRRFTQTATSPATPTRPVRPTQPSATGTTRPASTVSLARGGAERPGAANRIGARPAR